MRFLERAPKAAPRRPAPGRAQCVGSTRPLHPERDTAARGSCQRGLDSRAPPRGGDVNRLKFINTVKFYCISGPQDLYPGGGAGGQADSFAPSDFPADTWPLGHSPLGHGGREPAGQRQTAPLHLPTTALPRAATGAPRVQGCWLQLQASCLEVLGSHHTSKESLSNSASIQLQETQVVPEVFGGQGFTLTENLLTVLEEFSMSHSEREMSESLATSTCMPPTSSLGSPGGTAVGSFPTKWPSLSHGPLGWALDLHWVRGFSLGEGPDLQASGAPRLLGNLAQTVGVTGDGAGGGAGQSYDTLFDPSPPQAAGFLPRKGITRIIGRRLGAVQSIS
ncbi:PREDICTED: uncharacterized protein LOC105853783 isoform X2 [Condylura cristata]|uniref:uncharacterized protein LOC105853783 isoform X2 n=1 Tax=Condylura cristata TaxID=143302 RepID=UPI00064398D8|nr:PREDICTED: uncharacterized protein LOC105853783 isoform X2 [Condylura cristata]